jgi:NADPH-dependent glutamate synthase beta subunit-like oxidoreductase
MVRGADLVVTAIADARKAAIGIVDYLVKQKNGGPKPSVSTS